jgi:hypothetical protein
MHESWNKDRADDDGVEQYAKCHSETKFSEWNKWK